jgi:hypothetical protein
MVSPEHATDHTPDDAADHTANHGSKPAGRTLVQRTAPRCCRPGSVLSTVEAG